MIHEIDEGLEALVKREVLEGSGAEVVFDAPTKDWALIEMAQTLVPYSPGAPGAAVGELGPDGT